MGAFQFVAQMSSFLSGGKAKMTSVPQIERHLLDQFTFFFLKNRS